MKGSRLFKIITLIFTSFFMLVALSSVPTVITDPFSSDVIQSVRLEAYENLMRVLSDPLISHETQLMRVSVASESEAKGIAAIWRGTLKTYSTFGYAVIELPSTTSISKVAEHVKNQSLILKIHPVTHIQLNDTPVNPADIISYEQMVEYLNIESAWLLTKGAGIKIGVIDTGIDINHPKLSSKISEFSYNASTKMIGKLHVHETTDSHGTGVAGITSALLDEETGVQGLAPDADLIVIKANYVGYYLDYDLIEGIYYAADIGVDVLNMSFGSQIRYNPFEEALAYAIDKGVILVGSAGNNGSIYPHFPASSPDVISVGALNAERTHLASYSNYGRWVDMVAPGTVLTTTLNGGYEVMPGTSFAAPIVTSAIALYLAMDPSCDHTCIRTMITHTSNDIGETGRDMFFSFGSLNVGALISSEKVEITYLTGTGDVIESFPKHASLRETLLPYRDGYTFGGWFLDEALVQEIELNVDLISSNTTLYPKWLVGIHPTHPSSFVFQVEGGEATLHYYIGKEPVIQIPETYQGIPITRLGISSFSQKSPVRSVIFNENIRIIESYAFAGSDIYSITFPKNSQLESIMSFAFEGNEHLRHLEFPDTLQTIGLGAFNSMYRLVSLEFGSMLEYLENFGLQNETRFSAIHISEENPNFSSIDGVLFNKDKSELILYPLAKQGGYYKIPDTVLEIKKDNAFTNNKYLRILELGSETEISVLDMWCFYGMHLLESFIVPETNPYHTSIGGILYDKKGEILLHIPSLHNLSQVVIPESAKAIHKNAGMNLRIQADYRSIGIDSLIFLNLFSEENDLQLNPQYVASYHRPIIETLEVIRSVSTFLGPVFPIENIIMHEDAYDTYMLTSYAQSNRHDFIQTFNQAELSVQTLKPRYHQNDLWNIGISLYSDEQLVITLFAGSLMDQRHRSLFSRGENCVFNIASQELSVSLNYLPTVTWVTNSPQVILPFQLETSDQTLNAPFLDDYPGHWFAGWYLDAQFTLPFHDDEVNEDIVLFAKWEKKTISIDYYDGETLLKSEMVLSGETITYLPEKENQVFEGWFTSSHANISYYNSESGDEDLILYARYVEDIDRQHVNQFVFHDIGTGYEIIGYLGSEEIVEIPYFFYPEGKDKYEGKYVNRIGEFAFHQNSSIRHVTLSHYIRSIGTHAFSETVSLETVSLNPQLKTINDSAFQKSGIQTIHFPSSVEYVGVLAFYETKRLSSVTFDVSSRLHTIESYAFAATSVTHLSLPDQVRFIGRGGFALNGLLESVKLPKYLTTLGRETFQLTPNLKTVVFPETLVSIDEYGFINTGMEVITLPESLQTIRYQGFAFNFDLRLVHFNPQLKVIEAQAFWKAPLETMNIGSELEYVHTSSFIGNPNLSFIHVDPLNPHYASTSGILFDVSYRTLLLYPSQKQGSLYVLPDSVTAIGDGAFNMNHHLSEVVLPEHLIAIGQYAFHGSSSLQTIQIPETVRRLSAYSFSELYFMDTLVIPEGVEVISKYAFKDSGFQQLYLPDSVKYIQESAFMNMRRLEWVSFPDDVMIRGSLFYNLTGVSALTHVLFRGTIKADPSVSGFGHWFIGSPHLRKIVVHKEDVGSLQTYFQSSGEVIDPYIVFYDEIETETLSYTINNADELNNIHLRLMVDDMEAIRLPIRYFLNHELYAMLSKRGIYDLSISYQGSIIDLEIRRSIQIHFEFNIDTMMGDQVLLETGFLSVEAPLLEKYTFVGWYKDPYYIIPLDLTKERFDEDATIYGLYYYTVHTVTFLDEDGITELGTSTVFYGENASAPEAPLREGHTFVGWNQPFDQVTEDLIVIAIYQINSYTITFLDEDGITELGTSTVFYGENASAPEAPLREGHTFVGWNQPFDQVTEDLIVIAIYQKHSYTITFFDEDGITELGTSTVFYGEKASAPEAPLKIGTPYYDLIFSGWDRSIDAITMDQTVRAVYEVQLLDFSNLILPGIDHIRTGESWADAGIGLVGNGFSYDIIGEVNSDETGSYVIQYDAYYKNVFVTSYYRHVHVLPTRPDVQILLNADVTTLIQDMPYLDAGAVSNQGTIEVIGTVDTSVPGTYVIRYRVTLGEYTLTKSKYVTVLSLPDLAAGTFRDKALPISRKEGFLA
jgi:uncharacterized repeat protein (TIGR02543 family)